MDRQKQQSLQNKKTSLTYTELQILSCLFEHGEEYARGRDSRLLLANINLLTIIH